MNEASRLADKTASRDPAVGLRAVASLRVLLETLEDLQVNNAREQGWSWQQIADALGVSRQAVHKKHGGRPPGAGRIPSRLLRNRSLRGRACAHPHPEPQEATLMFERFADSARQVVTLAQDEAATLHAGHIGTEHLLVALADEPSGPAGRALRGLGLDAPRLREGARRPGELDPEALALLGIDLDEVRRRVEAAFGPGALDRRRPARRRGNPVHADVQEDARARAAPGAVARRQLHRHPAHPARGCSQAEDEPSVALLRGQGRSLDEVRAALLAEIEPGSAGQRARR